MKLSPAKKVSSLKKYKEDYVLSIFVVSYFFAQSLNMAIKQILPMSDKMWQLLSNGFLGLLFMLMLTSIGIMLRRRGIAFFCTEVLFLLLYLISFLLGNASTKHLLSTAFWTLGVCIPLGFYVLAIENKQILLNFLRKVGFVQSIVLWVTLYQMNNLSTYSMSASYALLLPTLVFLSRYFAKHSMIDLIFSLISSVMILLFGARGPLLCVLFYILLQVVFLMKWDIRKVVFLLLGSICLIVLTFAHNWLLEIVFKLMQRFGLYSRTIMQMIHGSILSSSGRDELFSYYWNLILQKPIFGWGLLGGWLGPGSGPHNMLLEFLLAFGIIFGGLLCVFLICKLFQVLFLTNGPVRELLAIFTACIFTKYLIAGFILQSPEFFIFLILSFSGQSRLLFRYRTGTICRGKDTIP